MFVWINFTKCKYIKCYPSMLGKIVHFFNKGAKKQNPPLTNQGWEKIAMKKKNTTNRN